MKLDFFSNGFQASLRPTISRVLFYSTEARTSTILKTKKDTLYSRISPVGNPSVSIIPILDQWIEEGKTVEKLEMIRMIKQLRLFKRFKHALEISQWMSDQRHMVLSPDDISVRMDLISKVHGIEQAEKYFNNIPNQSRGLIVYNALLNCYAHKKSVEKAEALMQQMRDLEFEMSPLTYNPLIYLYSQMGQYEKLDILMEEMKEKGVHPDKFTLNSQLSVYASTSDIDGMEKMLHMMILDPNIGVDWNCYAIAANGYIKAGLIEKALVVLKKSEELITRGKGSFAYDFLLTIYRKVGNKEHMHRIWNLYKSSEKVCNTGYKSMIGSLLQLDDIEGAEKIMEEWEHGDTTYDFCIPNMLIIAYCKSSILEKAEKLVNKGIEKGIKPYASTWCHLASGYVKANQMHKAVKAMKLAFLATRLGWKPNRDTLISCLVYLKQQGDREEAEEFVRLFGSSGHLSTDDHDRLRDYFKNTMTDFHIVDKVLGDGLCNDEET